jgi:hypothetical protein
MLWMIGVNYGDQLGDFNKNLEDRAFIHYEENGIGCAKK